MWDLVEGDIKRGTEVTVDGNISFELPNPIFFGGAVVSDSYVSNGFILLKMMTLYFINAVAISYVFESSFQSQM